MGRSPGERSIYTRSAAGKLPMKPKPKPVEYLAVGLACYLAAGVIAWAKTSFAHDFRETITAFVYIFLFLGTLGIVVAAVARYLSSTGPKR